MRKENFESLSGDRLYCPICGCVITASNRDEVESGEHEGYLFVHKEIPHSDEDIDALMAGIN